MLTKFTVMTAVTALLALGDITNANAQEFYGTLEQIKETGTIVIGHRESSVPFSYYDKNGKAVGYSIDLCMKIVDAVKKKLNMSQLKVRFLEVNPQTRIPLIANGTVNIECGTTTNTLTREEQVDFSLITFTTGARLMVQKGSGINEIEDLKGKSIGVALGTTNERVVKNLITTLHIPNVSLHYSKDHVEGVLALETNRIDAYATDEVVLYGLLSKSRMNNQLELAGRYLSYEPFGFMVRRDDSAFRLVVDSTLADLFRSGEAGNMFKKWFDPLGIPMSEELKSAYRIQALPH